MFTHTSATVAVLVGLSSIGLAADTDIPLVHVSGRGAVRVAPDQVVIALTVTTTDDDLIRVRENSDKDARTILTIAKKHGVADEGFDVSRLDLSLDYNEQLRRQTYQVERGVTLTLDDLTKLDAMLSDLLGERNLKVVGVNFVTSKIRQHELEALTRAMADAKEKAAHLAKLNGLKLGKARDIHVIDESQRPFVTSVLPVVGSLMPRTARPKVAAKTADVRFVVLQTDDDAQVDGKPFALGMIEITADVTIDFELAE